MKRSAVLLNTLPAPHARCSARSDKPHKLAVILSVMCISCVMTVMAAETRWQQYQNAGTEAYQQGDYSEAVRQIQLALKEAEDFGEEDPRFAISLNNLAELYRAQGRYAEAEPIYKRSLAKSQARPSDERDASPRGGGRRPDRRSAPEQRSAVTMTSETLGPGLRVGGAVRASPLRIR